MDKDKESFDNNLDIEKVTEKLNALSTTEQTIIQNTSITSETTIITNSTTDITPPSSPRNNNNNNNNNITPLSTPVSTPPNSRSNSSIKRGGSSLTSSGVPFKTLKNFIKYGLIDENCKCKLEYKTINKVVKIINFTATGENALFSIQSPIDESKSIDEQSATTLLRKYLTELNDPNLPLPAKIEGNKFLFLNYKKMDSFTFDKVISETTNNESSTPSTTTTTTTTTYPSSPYQTPSKGSVHSPTPSTFVTPAITNVLPTIRSNTSRDAIEIQYEFLPVSQESKVDSTLKFENARIKASGIGRYFHFGCDKYFAYSTRSSMPLSESSVGKAMNLVQSELINDGFRWEKMVLDHLEEQYNNKQSDYKIFKPKDQEQDITVEETLRILKEENTGSNYYIFQSTLEVPKSFNKDLPEFISFSKSKPDYLKFTYNPIDKSRTIQIQDAKSTNQITFSQKIQLAFYYLLLNEIIKVNSIPNLKVSETASIYLKDNYQMVEFSMQNSIKILNNFIFGDDISKTSQLLRILSQPKEESDWVLTERCDSCEYIEQCTIQANSEKSINSLANVDHLALKSLIQNSSTSEIEQLKNLNLSEIKENALSIEFLKSKSTVKAFIDKSIEFTGLYDFKFSSYEDVEVYIQLLHYPLDQTINHWGIKIVDNFTSSTQFEDETSFRSLILTLQSTFVSLDKSGQSLQCYMFDQFERSLFFSHCFTELKAIISKEELSVEENEYQNSLLVVLRTLLYSCKDWLNLNLQQYPEAYLVGLFSMKQPYYQEETSILLIKDLVKKSVVLSDLNPIYNFEKIVSHLFKSTKEQELKALTNDYAFSLMKLNTDDSRKSIQEIIKIRLNFESQIIKLLKDSVFKPLNIIKPCLPFQIRKTITFKNDDLKKLYFCYQQENISTFRKIKAKRSNPLDINLLSGDYLLLEYLSKEDAKKDQYLINFKCILSPAHLNRFNVLFEKLSFNSLFLTKRENYNDLVNINDNVYTQLPNSEKMEQIQGISYEIIENPLIPTPLGKIELHMKLKLKNYQIFKNGDEWVEENSNYVLFDSFNIKYYQMHKTLLSNYYGFFKPDQQPSIFLEILSDPSKWIEKVTSSDNSLMELSKVVKESVEYALANNPQCKLKMTQSQESIFESLIQKRLQLILGPPGTGKTHFLALVVIILMEIHQRQQKPFRVVITSHTHTAIDNLLQRISQLRNEFEKEIGTSLGFFLTKHQSNEGGILSPDTGITKFDKKTDFERQYLCLGSTCWGLGNMSENIFDLLIIDEASQLNSYIGILAFNKCKPDTGRIIVCGDSKQLGPVLGDLYSQESQKSKIHPPTQYSPKVHKSVFLCLKSLIKHKTDQVPYLVLSENFRMNKELCKFSSDTLYGDSYKCFSESQSLVKPFNEQQLANQNSLIKSIFSSDRSCHTILLDNQQFGNKEIEMEIVKHIYKFLNPNSILGEEKSNIDKLNIERDLWRSKLGVITPLHEQRNLIQFLIRSIQTHSYNIENVDPVVNTVETIQGQEFDNIILCYNGFSDRNRISEFSFNLNRLNVGFTRSKQRFILIVSSKLLQPDELIFNNKKMSIAYDHLFNYIQASKIHQFNIVKTDNLENDDIKENLSKKLSELLISNNQENKEI